MLYNIIQYYTILYDIIQYFTILYNIQDIIQKFQIYSTLHYYTSL